MYITTDKGRAATTEGLTITTPNFSMKYRTRNGEMKIEELC